MCIEKNLWNPCRLCGAKIEVLAKKYGGCGIYFPNVFISHVEKDHNISIEQYFETYIERPICPCGICGEKLDIKVPKCARFEWREYKCGRYPGTLEWSEAAKEGRCGQNNPMYGKEVWNKGLTKETSEKVRQTAIKLKQIFNTEECRKKRADSAIKSLRIGWRKQLETKPHLAMRKILTELNLIFKEEVPFYGYFFDFKLSNGIPIEVDGDYFHSNPKMYPNGPVTYTQKCVRQRDLKKNMLCHKDGILLLRFWECDILNNPEYVKEEILWHVNKLPALHQSA